MLRIHLRMTICSGVFFCILILVSCSGTNSSEQEARFVAPDSISICFLNDSDFKLGNKLNTVLRKRKGDENFHVVEEYPYISAHAEPKGDRVYRSNFGLNGEEIYEELNFTDSVLIAYSASYTFSQAVDPRVFKRLTCDITTAR